MRATRAQTSPVFAVWANAGGIEETLEGLATGDALLGGRIDGEIASEKLLVWRVAGPRQVAAIARRPSRRRALRRRRPSPLRDGRAYAAERRAAEPDAPPDASFEHALVYLAGGGRSRNHDPADPRLVRPGPGIAFSLDDLWHASTMLRDGTGGGWPGRARRGRHRCGTATTRLPVVAHDGAAVLPATTARRRVAA